MNGDPHAHEPPDRHGPVGLDTVSSRSRQHYIDTGRYLTVAESRREAWSERSTNRRARRKRVRRMRKGE